MLTISETIRQLKSLRENSADFARTDNDPVWQRDIAACEGVIAILGELQAQGLRTIDDAIGRIHSYPVIRATCRELKAHFETGGTPVKIRGLRCCPKCHEPVSMKNKHCPWCGKRLTRGWEKL